MAIENEIVVVKFIFCCDWENGVIVIALFLHYPCIVRIKRLWWTKILGNLYGISMGWQCHPTVLMRA